MDSSAASRLGPPSRHSSRFLSEVLRMRYLIPVSVFAALTLLPAGAPAQSQNSPDTTVAAARRAAQQDRYAEAAALFRKAIEQDPSRRPALLREYADELAYAGHP